MHECDAERQRVVAVQCCKCDVNVLLPTQVAALLAAGAVAAYEQTLQVGGRVERGLLRDGGACHWGARGRKGVGRVAVGLAVGDSVLAATLHVEQS